MNANTSRIIIETMVRKSIQDMQDSPKRSIRNLVDMALNFSGGRFQQRFFSLTQTMLKNENSPYYELVYDVAGHVDTERLVHFGINLGYNSCTRGAEVIRRTEESQGFNVPWMLTLHLDATKQGFHADRYKSIVEQGEKMGIYTWQLFTDSSMEFALSLAEQFPDSAFIIYCDHAHITPQMLDETAELSNLMLAVRYEEGAETLCRTLREMKLLYSVYHVYSAEDTVPILSDDLFYGIQQLDPVFAVLVPAADCPAETRTAVTAHVRKLREEQRFPLLLWEAVSDCHLVDSIISGDPYVAAFDADGKLHICDNANNTTEYNLFEDDLENIFRSALPRHI